MSKLFRLLTIAALFVPGAAFAREVLVQTTATNMLSASAPRGTRALEIQNLGPNSLWCEIDGSTPVENKSRQIAAGGTWQISGEFLRFTSQVKCLASSANQTTGAATIVNEGN